jgi:hypothetical protein
MTGRMNWWKAHLHGRPILDFRREFEFEGKRTAPTKQPRIGRVGGLAQRRSDPASSRLPPHSPILNASKPLATA